MTRTPLYNAVLVAVLLMTGTITVSWAQTSHSTENEYLSEEQQREIIDAVLQALREGYVFPEVAEAMGEAITDRVQEGVYQHATDVRAFADSLTAHLQAISRDKHLRIRYEGGSPEMARRSSEGPSADMIAAWQRLNFGFEEVSRLPGNVGYLSLRGFLPEEQAAETAAAAMSFLAHTDGLIIDLRRNGGGDPAMVAHLVSYFLPADSILINTIYQRPEDETEEFWNRIELSGPRYGAGRPVFILTSARTFSGGEEFAYDMKHLERAMLVGEVTGGGANPVRIQPAAHGFVVSVPTGRAINPITRTNWEGTGVTPHIETDADCALEEAHLRLLQQLTRDAEAAGRRPLGPTIEDAEAALESARATHSCSTDN